MDILKKSKEEKQYQRKKYIRIKDVIVIIIIIVALVASFTFGYMYRGRKINTISKDSSTTIDEVYQILNTYWLNPNDKDVDLQKGTIEAMVEATNDPFTSYMSADEAVEFNNTVDGDLEGIGLSYVTISGGALATEVYNDTGASDAGIKAGDVIVKADGDSLAGLSSTKIQSKIRGKAGTKVELTIERNGKYITTKAERRSLDISVQCSERTYGSKKIGFIQINTFGNSIGEQIENALQTFEDDHIATLVFDLRGNGGGYLSAATDLLDLFFTKDDCIYQMQGKTGAAKKYYAETNNKYTFTNGYILADGNTASASELFIGAMTENLGYKVIGTTTYGKGIAQTQATLSDGSVLKYTYARWLTPSGKCIQGEGFTPDYEVDSTSTADLAYTYKKTLDYDTVSKNVKYMQKMLKVLGYDCGRTDGYFSKDTQTAWEKFEKKYSLTQDGKCTTKELTVLDSVYYKQQSKVDRQYNKLLSIMK